MSERTQWTYVSGNSRLAVYIDAPVGLILPPILALHRPEVGEVTFYQAEAYGLPDYSGSAAGSEE